MTEASSPPLSATPKQPVVTPVRVICGLLLLAPFVALLWVDSYSRMTPALIGIPFFYWYQLMWVVLSAALTGVIYLLFTREEKQRRAARAASATATAEGERA